MELILLETLSRSSCLAQWHPPHVLSHLVQPLRNAFEDDDTPPVQKPGPDKIPDSDSHPLKLPSGVGWEPMPGTMVGLDTCADRHSVLRPVMLVNSDRKNRGHSQAACAYMNLGVDQVAEKECLEQTCPVGARRSVRHSCLHGFKKFRDIQSRSTRHDG